MMLLSIAYERPSHREKSTGSVLRRYLVEVLQDHSRERLVLIEPWRVDHHHALLEQRVRPVQLHPLHAIVFVPAG